MFIRKSQRIFAIVVKGIKSPQLCSMGGIPPLTTYKCITNLSHAVHNKKDFSSHQNTIGRIKPTISIIFTCNVCRQRQAKTMSKRSYEKGVVLIKCDGCENIHLIADNLGWFKDNSTNIADILKEKNEEVKTLGSIDLLDVADLDLFKDQGDDPS